jgi:hypothetical protein
MAESILSASFCVLTFIFLFVIYLFLCYYLSIGKVKEMADKANELYQFSYHLQSNGDRALTQQVDELAIANMLAVLNNPNLFQLLSTEEARTIMETVKNHVVIKSKLIGAIQQEKMASLDTGMSFK